jgi:pyruvate dehydrogenase E2 component (dihydrolipoamide acetyltransferase)
VRGTGRGGRIVLSDIRAFVEKLQEIAFTEKGGDRRKAAQQQSEQSKDTSQQPTEDFSKWGSVKRESLSSIRKTIGQKMQQSWTSIPHVYQFEEADITSLMKLRKKYKSAYSKKGTKLTLTALVIKAAVHALKEHPLFNASLDQANGEIVKKEYFHIGIAVDTEAGLLVPVIRDADQKDLVALSNELQEIAEKARNRELSTDEMKGSSFTISNLGGIGGTHFTPIVNQPNVAILGVGRGMERPVAKNGKLSSHTILPLCVSYDHRVIDGADGARFIKTLVEVFENFKEDELKTK